jgi:hypothetical protein
MRKRTLSEGGFVKMSQFLLDFAIEMPYPLAPPQGWEAVWIFDNLAVSNQRSAFSQSNPNFNHKGHPLDSFALLRRSGQAVEHEGGSPQTYANLG